ncbi:hypothetical protein COY23_00845, partial [bacterium (Candidatus Torokbacteria) CG_4_10_14_0_2_um_filter_35_8]
MQSTKTYFAKIALVFLLVLVFSFLGFTGKVSAQTDAADFLLWPENITVSSTPSSVVISVSNLIPDTEYKYALWVYSGKSIQETWINNLGSFRGGYNYDDTFTTDSKDSWQGLINFRLKEAPREGYNYYLKFQVKTLSGTKVCDAEVRFLEEGFTVVNSEDVGFISGRLIINDEKVENVLLGVFDQNDNYVNGYLTEDNDISEGQNENNAGYFKIAVPEGSYKLKAFSSEDFSLLLESSDTYFVTKGETTLINSNSPPVAVAGQDIICKVGEEIQVSALSSYDPDGDKLSFVWDFDDRTDPTFTATATHIYEDTGEYIVSLEVSDGFESDFDSLLVSVLENEPPEVNAGEDKQVFVEEEVFFEGQASDSDGLIVLYKWDFDGDGVWDFTSTTAGNASFTFDTEGVFNSVFQTEDDNGGFSQDSIKVTVQQKTYDYDIFISELLPNPEGSDLEFEFIELFNNEDTEVNLDSFYLDDFEGGSAAFLLNLSHVILPKGYLVLYREETSIALNNDTDSVRLFDPNGKLVSEIDYHNSPENCSYSLDLVSGDFQWTSTLTPNAENEFSDGKDENSGSDDGDNEEEKGGTALASNSEDNNSNSNNLEKIFIKEVHQKSDDDEVFTQGIVLVEPGVLSKNYFYIQDEESGVQIYSSASDFPEIKLGDKIEVKGIFSSGT